MERAGCPQRDRVPAYVLGGLDDKQQEEIARHLGNCQSCQATADELQYLIALMRQPASLATYLDEPECQEAVAKAVSICRELREHPRKDRLRLWNVVAIAAVVMLVVAGGVVAVGVFARFSGNDAPEPIVALPEGNDGDFKEPTPDHEKVHRPDEAPTRIWVGSDSKGIAAYDIKMRSWATANPDESISDCTEAIRLNPNDVSAYYARGIVYSAKGDLDEAIADFSEVIRLDPEYYDAYLSRGCAFRKKDDHARAEDDFAKANVAFPPALWSEAQTTEGTVTKDRHGEVLVIGGTVAGPARGHSEAEWMITTRLSRIDGRIKMLLFTNGDKFFGKGIKSRRRNGKVQVYLNEVLVHTIACETLGQYREYWPDKAPVGTACYVIEDIDVGAKGIHGPNLTIKIVTDPNTTVDIHHIQLCFSIPKGLSEEG